VEAHRKDGAKSFREREGASTPGPTTGSNRTGRKSLLKRTTSRPGTGPWTKPLPGPTISSAAIIMENRFKSPQPPFTKGGRGGIFPAKGLKMGAYLDLCLYLLISLSRILISFYPASRYFPSPISILFRVKEEFIEGSIVIPSCSF
jgi:hypothetical protein